MITEDVEDSNKKAFDKIYSEALNATINIRAGVLKRYRFKVQVRMKGSAKKALRKSRLKV